MGKQLCIMALAIAAAACGRSNNGPACEPFAGTNFSPQKAEWVYEAASRIKALTEKGQDDVSEKEILRLLQEASRKKVLNRFLLKLDETPVSGCRLLEKIILRWDNDIPEENASYILGRVSNEVLLQKPYEPPVNSAARSDLFLVVFKDRTVKFDIGLKVARYLNKNYTKVGVVVGEDIQNNFLFLLLNKDLESFSRDTLLVAREIFKNDDLKPDHLQRVYPAKKMLADYFSEEE